MPIARRYTSRAAIPETSGQALADIGALTDTGAEVMGKAISGIGQVVGGFGEQLAKQSEDERKLKDELLRRKRESINLLSSTQAMGIRKEAREKFERFKADNPPDKWEEEAIKIRGESDKQVAGLPFSSDILEREQLEQHLWGESFGRIADLDTTKEYARQAEVATRIELIDALKENDNSVMGIARIEDATVAYQDALSNKYTREIVEDMLKDAVVKGRRGYWEKRVDLFPEETIPLVEAKLDVMRKTGKPDEDGLTTDDYNDVLSRARRQIAITKRELREKQDETVLGLYEKVFVQGELLGWDDITNTNLEPNDKISFWEKYQQVQSEKIKLGVSILEEGDPVVRAKTNAIIDLRPGDITPAEIYQLADVGLGLKYIPGLVDRLKRNRKELEDNPIAAKYKSELSRLLNAGIFGDKEDVETSDVYLDLSRKLDTFIETKPSEMEAQIFFGHLIREDVRTLGMLFGENTLPGFGDRPMEVTLTTKEGEEKKFKVIFGDIIEFEGHYLQAIGREEGKVKWLEVSPQ